MSEKQTLNYINGKWTPAAGATAFFEVINPASNTLLTRVPLSSGADVDTAVQAAQIAYEAWRRTPPVKRIQYLFKFKALLEENIDELARIITDEAGKTYNESIGELRRGIENVEVACGIPMMMQGTTSEDIATGIDEMMIRQPLGVVAAITPFNFPGMIPLWFLPYAIATGNSFILKPSEKVPLTAQKLFELIDRLDLPAGVLQLVHGGKETVDAILDHPLVRAVSFVGSTPVAQYVYRRATANGKRAQCQGGAKNPVVIMPDADMDVATRILADSAFGCAGQRCLAMSVAVPVGDAADEIVSRLAEVAVNRRVGYGLDEGVEMGPVITPESRKRIEGLIATGVAEGASLVVDGRGKTAAGYEKGNFIFPTLFDHVDPRSEIARTEIFGPVLSVTRAATLDEAIALVNDRPYGNMACIFTRDGSNARHFRYDVQAGNVGINIGVAAPMAFFPFSGWRDSFFGDLHAQGAHAVEFYTQTKVVIERWLSEWSRQF